jgi:hypothetical protein
VIQRRGFALKDLQSAFADGRQLATDHDYAARPANIRSINRRPSELDRYPLYLQKAKPMKRKSNINPG